MKILIYKLIDPITNDVRYVGKTKNTLTKRLYEHLTLRNLKTNTHKNNWIKKLIRLKLRPIIELVEEVTEDTWISREIYWINYFKELNHNLTNTADGGEGSFGYKMPKDSIRKAIETRRKNGTLKRSEKCKKRISKSKLGKKHTQEHTERSAEKIRVSILQCDINGNEIKAWKGIRKCANELKTTHSTIIKYLDTNIPYMGFIWKRL